MKNCKGITKGIVESPSRPRVVVVVVVVVVGGRTHNHMRK